MPLTSRCNLAHANNQKKTLTQTTARVNLFWSFEKTLSEPTDSKPRPQSFKTPVKNNTASIATINISNVIDEDQNKGSVSTPTNSDILGSIHSLKEDFANLMEYDGRN